MTWLSLLDHFSALADPRQHGKVLYPMPDWRAGMIKNFGHAAPPIQLHIMFLLYILFRL